MAEQTRGGGLRGWLVGSMAEVVRRTDGFHGVEVRVERWVDVVRQLQGCAIALDVRVSVGGRRKGVPLASVTADWRASDCDECQRLQLGHTGSTTNWTDS